MRKNIVAGNWKMNKTLQEGIALAKELNAREHTAIPAAKSKYFFPSVSYR